MSTFFRRLGALLAFGCGLCAVAAPAASAQVIFDGPPGTTRLFSTSINAANVVAGWYVDSSGASHGFVRDPATAALSTFSLLPCSGCLSALQVEDINGKGMIVGDAAHPGSSPWPKAFVCTLPCSSVGEINQPGWGTVQGAAGNDSGAVVGTWAETRPPFHAHGYVRDRNGGITSFDAPVPAASTLVRVQASAINDDDDIAGTSFDSAGIYRVFLRDARGGFATYLINGNTGLAVTGLTNDGEIVGWYSDAQGTHGFTIATGRYRHDASAVDYPGAASTVVTAANNPGALVGYYTTMADGPQHAFLRDAGGTFVNLDIANAAATVARSINDHGTVTGYCIDSAGGYHGFIR